MLKIILYHATSFLTLFAVLGMVYGNTVLAEDANVTKVNVGVMVPLTGPFARYGRKIQEAVSTYGNAKVSFVFEDEACDPKIGISAYQKLATFDRVKIFLGPVCGTSQTAVAPQLINGKHLAVLGSSASEEIFNMSDGRMFSTQPSIEAESTFIAEQLNKSAIQNVMIIFAENAFSRAHEAAFRSHFQGKIIDTLSFNPEDVSALKNIALKVKRAKPNALYVPDAFPFLAGLSKELKAIGLHDTRIYSVYSIQSEDIINAVGSSGEGIIYSYPDIGNEDAIQYFPSLAAKLIVDAATTCGDQLECFRSALMARNTFDAHGVIAGRLILKTIRDGKFVPLL